MKRNRTSAVRVTHTARNRPPSDHSTLAHGAASLRRGYRVYAAARSVERDDEAAQPSDTQSYALGVSYRFDIALN